MMGNKVQKAGLFYTIGNFLIKGINFLMLPIFAKLLTQAEFGLVNTYLAYDSILFIFTGLALHSSLKNAKYDYEDKFDQYVSNIVLLITINTVLLLILGNAFSGLIKQFLGINQIIINILVLNSLGTAMITFYNVRVGLDYEYKKYLAISFSNTICNVFVSLFLVLGPLNAKRYYGRVFGIALPIILLCIVIICLLWKKRRPRICIKDWKYGLAYSLPIIPHGLSQIVLNQFDRIMIERICGAAKAGIYSLVYNIYTIFIVIANSLDSVWGPWFYERMSQNDHASIKKHSSTYAFLMGIVIILLMLVSPEILMIISPKSYWEGKYAMMPILLQGYFAFLYTLPAQVEYYKKKTSWMAISTVSAAVINVILNAYFIPRYGYIAAAYTTAFSYMLYFTFHYCMAYRLLHKCLFNTKKILLYICLVIFIMIISLYFVECWWVRYVVALGFGLIGLYSLYKVKVQK